MDTMNAPGRDLHSEDENARKSAASTMGKARTEKKIAAARATAESRRGVKWTDEQKAKLRESQAARREREAQERAALGLDAAPTEKKKAGRPAKIKPEVEAAAPRPRGRPKKQSAGNTTIGLETPQNAPHGEESLLQEGNKAE